MTTKVILYFPSDATDKAVTYDLVKRYDPVSYTHLTLPTIYSV